MASNGRFVWHELMTTDVEAAKAFYTEVIGWKTQPFEGGGPMEYTMWCVGDEPMGGVMLLPDEAKQMGAPPHWLGHVAVRDLDRAVAKTKELGGQVLNEMEVPEVGKFAIVRDPQGAVLSWFQPAGDMANADVSRDGMVGWNELNTTDYEAAWPFYRGVLGWQETEAMDMGDDMGTYFMFKHEGAANSMGGMSNVAKQMNMPAHWLFYINVDDMDAACKRIESNGGKVVNGPMEVPGGSHIAQCQDPQGVFFAIHCMNK